MRILKALLAGAGTFLVMVLAIALLRAILELQFDFRWPLATSLVLDLVKVAIPIVVAVKVYKGAVKKEA